MSETRFVINLDFKGRADLDSILRQIGAEHKIPVDIDLSKAKLGIIRDLNQPLKEAIEGFRAFTTHAGFVISGSQKIYGVLQSTIGRVVGAAAEAQNAQIGLSGALRATGMEVEQNTRRLLGYASSLQKLTVYDDEMLAGSMAQMQNIARFGDVSTLETATKAAIGLSAAFGIDLATAMDLVGKAAAGNTAMLGRYGLVLDEGASQAEKFNQVLSRGLQYFPIAEQYANSQVGSMQQLRNAWGDFLETLGEGVLPVVKALTDTLKPMIDFATAMSAMGLAADRARADLEKLAQQSIDLARAQARVNVMESRWAAVDAAAETQQLKLRLVSLYQSTEISQRSRRNAYNYTLLSTYNS